MQTLPPIPRRTVHPVNEQKRVHLRPNVKYFNKMQPFHLNKTSEEYKIR